MAFLGGAKKCDLLKLATELGEVVNEKLTMAELKKIITKSQEYDEDFAKNILDVIKKDRIAQDEKEVEIQREEKQERERAFELERQEKELERQEKELEKQERERAFELERQEKELENQERERVFELEKKKLDVELEKVKLGHDPNKSPNSFAVNMDIKKLLSQFKPKEDDISLFLEMFERQVKVLGIPIQNWVSQLIAVLPNEIVQLIAREPEDEVKDYQKVKLLLIQKFKLSAERFRQLFFQHQKKPEVTWHDFCYEIKTYLENWITGLNIESFEQLKDLMIVEQIKKRASLEFKEKYLDEWITYTSSRELSKKLEDFEDVRRTIKSEQLNINLKDTRECSLGSSTENEYRRQGGRTVYHKVGNDTKQEFERSKRLQCFECESYDHLRPQCPNLKKDHVVSINYIRVGEDDELFAPYTTRGKVNGREVSILRDTGSTIDVISQEYITPNMLTGEKVWVRQVFQDQKFCLPIAEVEIDCKFGHLITKAAVIRKGLDRGRYLLGNQTATLFENMKRNRQINIEVVNANQARAQRKQFQDNHNGKEIEMQAEENISENFENKTKFGKAKDKNLHCVLKKSQDAKLHIKPSKCEFAKSQGKYLGHLVGQGQRAPGELKKPTKNTNVDPILAFLRLKKTPKTWRREESVTSSSDYNQTRNRLHAT